MGVPYWAPFCYEIVEEPDCSGIIMIQLELEDSVSLSVSFLEEKTWPSIRFAQLALS